MLSFLLLLLSLYSSVISTFILTILKSNNFSLQYLDASNLPQYFSFPTHQDLHTLDLLITASSSSVSPIIDYLPVSPSDHFPIFSTLTISTLPPPPLSTLSLICLKYISISKFKRDIANLCSSSTLLLIYMTLSTLTTPHSPLFAINTLLLKPKPFLPKLQTLGLLLPQQNLNLLNVISRKSGSELVLLKTSNHCVLLLMHITRP